MSATILPTDTRHRARPQTGRAVLYLPHTLFSHPVTRLAALHLLEAAAGGTGVVCYLHLTGKLAAWGGKAFAQLAAWRKRATEQEKAAKDAEIAELRAEKDRLQKMQELVNTSSFDLIKALEARIDAQDESIAALTSEMAQVREAAASSDVSAQVAHERADDAIRNYTRAKAELDALRVENALLLDRVNEAAQARAADQETIKTLTAHIAENLARIDHLENELAKHRLPLTFNAQVTLTGQDDN